MVAPVIGIADVLFLFRIFVEKMLEKISFSKGVYIEHLLKITFSHSSKTVSARTSDWRDYPLSHRSRFILSFLLSPQPIYFPIF